MSTRDGARETEQARGTLRFRAAAARVARAVREEREVVRSDAGPGAALAGTSLWVFGAKNRFRVRVFKIMYSERMEYIVLALILAHFVTLVMLSSSQNDGASQIASLGDFARAPLRALDAAIVCAYSLEAVLRIISLGFIGHKHAYMASFYNQLDLVIIATSWFSTSMEWHGNDGMITRLRLGQLRLFRGILAIKRFKLATNVVFIAESLQKSISLLRDVTAITVVCMVFYALMGMGIFGGSLRRRCVETTDATTANMFYTSVSDPELFCGDSSNALDHKGYVCPGVYDANSTLFCSDLVGNPKHGYQSFDSFGSTLLAMFQCITIESWQEIMYPIVNAEYKSSAAYFITLIIVGTYFIVSVFVAAISGVFLRLRREHQTVLRNKSGKSGDEENDEIEDDAAMRRLIRRLKGGTDESLASVAEAALSRKRLLEDEETEIAAIPSGVTRPKRDRLLQYITNRVFDRLVKFCIAANIAVMALYRYDLDAERKLYLLAFEGLFVSAFMLEVCVRLLAARNITVRLTQFKSTNEDLMLFFDVVVVALSAMVMWEKGINLTPLRIPRLFKSFEQSRRRSRDTITRVFRSLGALFSLFLFYSVILAMYAVLGMQLFANQHGLTEDAPRLNYDTFPKAMLTLFTASTGEGWTDLMFHGILITKAAIPFYITFFILVNYIVLNLVIAVVLENLELRDVEKNIVQSDELIRRAVKMQMMDYRFVDFFERLRVKLRLTLSGRRWTKERAYALSPWLESRSTVEINVAKAVEIEITNSLLKPKSDAKLGANFVLCESKFIEVKAPNRPGLDMAPSGVDDDDEKFVGRSFRTSHQLNKKGIIEHDVTEVKPRELPTLKSFARSVSSLKSNDDGRVEILFDDAGSEASDFVSGVTLPWYMSRNSLGVFSHDGPTRVLLRKILDSKWYERVSYIFVIISILAVLATKPVDQENEYQQQVDWANYAVFGYFFTDFLFKIVANGILFTPAPYAGRIWNLCDLGILVIDTMIVACPIVLGSAYTAYWHRAFNMAAPVRPVRILTRVKSMQRLVKSLAVTLPTVGSVIVLTGAMFLAFAVIGIREYGGTFYSCNDVNVMNKLQCVGTFVDADGFTIAREWTRELYEFDWIGSAMLTLLETASLDAWVDILFSAMDKTGVDMQPEFEHNWTAVFFFVAFILISSFLMIRTIIGVFIHQFGLISGRKLLTERQKLWRDMHNVALAMKPIRAKVLPPRGLRRTCFTIVNHRFYRLFVLIAVSLNAILMSCERYGDEGTVFARARSIGEMCFVSVYLTEVLLQMIAAYPSLGYYLSNTWNLFEFILAAGSAATLRSRDGSLRDQIGRPFRFLRVFRVIRHVQSLQILASTLVLAVPSILSVMGLMLIWMFIYAGIGTQVFPNVKYGVALNKDANFQSFVSSFLLLFQAMTGEGWRQYMYDLMVTEPHCMSTETFSNCGFPDGAVLYFVTYVIAMGYIFTNLFVAAILDHVTFGVLREASLVTPKHLYHFQHVWSKHDPKATGYIGQHKLGELLRDIGPPLAVEFAGRLDGKSKVFCEHAHQAAALWRRTIKYESITLREHERGIPFTPLLESLLAAKLGGAALALDVRLARAKQLRDIETWGAAVTAQAWIRGFLVRRARGRHRARTSSHH